MSYNSLNVRTAKQKKIFIAILVLVLALIYTGLEVWSEEEKVSIFEFLLDTLEKALLIVGAGGVFILLHQMRRQNQERLNLMNELQVAKIEGQEWRKRAQLFVDGIAAEIEKQFRDWGLSQAESDIARLMVKGFSHKEIADLRNTAEATVRQQARNIYQKSKLPGRTALCSYFLEDLLPGREVANDRA